MAKYTFEFKKKVVFEYLYGKTGSTTLAKKYNIKSQKQVRQWIHNYQEFGDEGLKQSLTGVGTALTVEWNGVPASYLGVLTNAGILKADLFLNLQVVWTVQTGLSQMENGKTALMNQR